MIVFAEGKFVELGPLGDSYLNPKTESTFDSEQFKNNPHENF